MHNFSSPALRNLALNLFSVWVSLIENFVNSTFFLKGYCVVLCCCGIICYCSRYEK
jgi:hypothetical protein